MAKMLVRIVRPPPTIEGPPSVNSFVGCPDRYTEMYWIVLFLSRVLCGQSSQSILVSNFTNLMHAMSNRSDFFACSWRTNIKELAVCYTVWLLTPVFRVRSTSVLIRTTISDSKSWNASLLEVMISSKNERVIIRNFSYLTLQIIFDAWWDSVNEGLKRPIAWDNSRHAPSWRLYSHCGIEATGSPGIICIICHQVLSHPSDHGTSWMGKHLLAKAHIARLNELTETEVTEFTSTTDDRTALAILKRRGSREITIASMQRIIRSDIQFDPY